MYIFCYLLIGSIINICTMFKSEVWECWTEFGVTGFFIQFFISAVFFPLVLFALIKEALTPK